MTTKQPNPFEPFSTEDFGAELARHPDAILDLYSRWTEMTGGDLAAFANWVERWAHQPLTSLLSEHQTTLLTERVARRTSEGAALAMIEGLDAIP